MKIKVGYEVTYQTVDPQVLKTAVIVKRPASGRLELSNGDWINKGQIIEVQEGLCGPRKAP